MNDTMARSKAQRIVHPASSQFIFLSHLLFFFFLRRVLSFVKFKMKFEEHIMKTVILKSEEAW